MYETLIVFVICLIFVIISILPILDLKYKSDLALYIETVNKQCNLYEDKVPEKYKYLFNIVSTLFDDYKFTKNNDMNYYNWCVSNGTSILVMFILFYIIFIISFYYNFHNSYVSTNILITVSLYLIFYIVIFSITLKKLNDLYNDTDVRKYHNNLKNIKIKLDTPSSSYIIKQKYLYNTDNNICVDIGNLIYNTNNISVLIDGIDSSYDIDRIKDKINSVFILLIPYIYLILILIIFIFKILREMFDTIFLQFFILLIYVCIIFFYIIYINLE